MMNVTKDKNRLQIKCFGFQTFGKHSTHQRKKTGNNVSRPAPSSNLQKTSAVATKLSEISIFIGL